MRMSYDEEDEIEGSKSSRLSGRCQRNLAYSLGGLALEICVRRFSKDYFIGKFQFGEVYRGTHYGEEVIVKIWKEENFPGENKGRLEDERRLHEYFELYEFHPNVAKARAICHGRKHLACVYQLNPTAIDTLHNLIEKDTFKWEHRIKVAFGLASLLRYMHTPHPNCPSNLPYLIRNLDAAHILVDQDHEPVLFDFSMISGGILTDRRDLLNQYLQGWCCYSHPIGAQPGICSDKCDVYAYGVILLSLLSKRIYKHSDDGTGVSLPHNSVGCFGRKFNPFLLHESLECESEFCSSDAFKIMELALECMECDPQKRPSMIEIVGDLQKLHIVQHNANTWECCKMLDGVNEVFKMLHPPKHRRVKEFWQPKKLHLGSLKRCKYMVHGNESCGQSLARDFNIFCYKELIDATNSFGKENLIGQYLYGNLFWGVIKGTKVIVKMWEIDMERGIARRDNEDRLRDEISLLQHPELFCHPNLVKMIGYCFDEGKLGAVYDLDPQDTLHNLAPKDEFTWLQRMKVIYEFAELIKFFHAPNPPHAPYRVGNIEAANIILNKDYRPKLFDFGMTTGGIILSLREARNRYVPRRLRGYGDRTRGIYIEEGDIGAYGWILLCLISKTSPSTDVDGPIFDALRRQRYSEESSDVKQPVTSIVHGDLKQERGFNENDGIELTKLGLECAGSARPSMNEVVERLSALHVIKGCAEEMDIQNLPCRSNTEFELVCRVLQG